VITQGIATPKSAQPLLDLSAACHARDSLRALRDGTDRPDGCRLHFIEAVGDALFERSGLANSMSRM
jgi:hypothetical protein